MMAIMLGICIAGGVIFFAMWDYWVSEPAPVVELMTGLQEVIPVAPSVEGETYTYDLSFVESEDFLTLAFNALPGEPHHNPTIDVNVGDKIIFNVVNDGIMLHSFGVTHLTEGFAGIIEGTAVGSINDALLAGEFGLSEFIAPEEGTFYYICTIPGHRELGMVGEIIVGPAAQDGAGVPAVAADPTGVRHEFVLDFVESDDFLTFGFNALPGEEGGNPEIRVNSGDEISVTATNQGVSFHSFAVARSPEDIHNPLWESEIGSVSSPLRAGESGEVTFIAGAPGDYYYICTVPGHALQGMQGDFIVE